MSIPILYYATRYRFKANAKGAMKGKLRRFRNQRNVLATVPALVDFHETQIFFSITLQIVCQVALSKAEKLEAKTAGELVANQFLIKIIGAAGIYPIVLNLCTLYRQQRFLDWFILTASSCCVLMAVVTWSQAMSVSVLPYQLLTDDDQPPPGCGPANPMRFCISHVALHQVYDWLLKGRSLTLFDRVFLSGPPVALSLFAFLALVATRIEKFPGNCTKGCKVNVFQWLREEDLRRRPEGAQSSRPEQAFYALVAVWEIWLCFSTIMLLAGISFLMVPVVRQQPKWTIGNIIAVAVWVPVFIKWLHLLWRKYCLLDLLSDSKAYADSNQEDPRKALSTKSLLGMLLSGTIAQNIATLAHQAKSRCIPLRPFSRVKLLDSRHSQSNRRPTAHLQEAHQREVQSRTLRTTMWRNESDKMRNLLLHCVRRPHTHWIASRQPLTSDQKRKSRTPN